MPRRVDRSSSACSCSRAAPNPSMQASKYKWNGREMSVTASQLGKTRVGGVASPSRIPHTNLSIAGVNRNITLLRRNELTGRNLLDKSGKHLR